MFLVVIATMCCIFCVIFSYWLSINNSAKVLILNIAEEQSMTEKIITSAVLAVEISNTNRLLYLYINPTVHNIFHIIIVTRNNIFI